MNSVQRLHQHINGLNELTETKDSKVEYLYQAWGKYFLNKTEGIKPKRLCAA
jgi:hypothetical protein